MPGLNLITALRGFKSYRDILISFLLLMACPDKLNAVSSGQSRSMTTRVRLPKRSKGIICTSGNGLSVKRILLAMPSVECHDRSSRVCMPYVWAAMPGSVHINTSLLKTLQSKIPLGFEELGQDILK